VTSNHLINVLALSAWPCFREVRKKNREKKHQRCKWSEVRHLLCLHHIKHNITH